MDELSACAYLVLTHALRHPDLVAYRIPDGMKLVNVKVICANPWCI